MGAPEGATDFTDKRRRPERFVREALLDHPLRGRLYSRVRNRPGLNVSQLSRYLDADRSLAAHHVQKLEEHRVVELRKLPHTDERVLFHPEDLDLWEPPETRVLFGHKRTLAIARPVVLRPGITVKAISESVEVGPDTIRYHLRKLKDRDLIEHLNIGNSHLYKPSSVLKDWASSAFERGLQDSPADLVPPEGPGITPKN